MYRPNRLLEKVARKEMKKNWKKNISSRHRNNRSQHSTETNGFLNLRYRSNTLVFRLALDKKWVLMDAIREVFSGSINLKRYSKFYSFFFFFIKYLYLLNYV